MALVTYDDLKAQVANWLARDDLTDNIPDFITLFEAKIARKLNLRPTEAAATITMSSGSGPLPADFLGMRRLTWTGTPKRELDYVHPGYLKASHPAGETGIPNLFTIEAGNVLVSPSDDTALSILYRAKTPALVGSLNWLWTTYPDIYLYGTLAEAQGFNIDPEKLAMWKGLADEGIEDIVRNDFNERTNMSMRVMGPTP
jgi:hypothetical protein